MRPVFIISFVLLFFSQLHDAQADSYRRKRKLPAARCNESIFSPCICAEKVPRSIKYRPSMKRCGGDAAAILSGRFASSFSIVLRDQMNRDRFPPQGINGCSAAEVDAGLAKCSVYKAQKVIRKSRKAIHCFGAAGDEKLLEKATRMTIKVRDIPDSTDDPIIRICLNGFDPTLKLN